MFELFWMMSDCWEVDGERSGVLGREYSTNKDIDICKIWGVEYSLLWLE